MHLVAQLYDAHLGWLLNLDWSLHCPIFFFFFRYIWMFEEEALRGLRKCRPLKRPRRHRIRVQRANISPHTHFMSKLIHPRLQCLVFVLGATPNHILLNYSCPNKKSNRTWVVYLREKEHPIKTRLPYSWCPRPSTTRTWENWPLVINEPVKFERLGKFIDHQSDIYNIYLKIVWKHREHNM